MSYKIIWDPKVHDFLRKINKEDAKRIIKKVNGIVEDPKHYLETLVEIKSYKLRIGDYRALIDLDESIVELESVTKYFKKAKQKVDELIEEIEDENEDETEIEE